MSALATSGRWHRDWFDVAASDVRVGDVYANGASVTEVVRGPRPGDGYLDVKKGEVLIRCGESFSCKGKAARRVVVGRNPRFVWEDGLDPFRAVTEVTS